MDLTSPKISISKKEISVHKSLKKTYFDKYQNSKIGDDKFTLSIDELSILALPYIDINHLIDRCVLDRQKITKLLIKLLIDINPVNNVVDKNAIYIDDDIYMTFLQQSQF